VNGRRRAACPICGEPAEQIDRGLFDGSGFGCKTHREFRVASSVLAEKNERPRQQWQNALTIAKRRAPQGARPLITTYDF
jgi:hypothetical protein